MKKIIVCILSLISFYCIVLQYNNVMGLTPFNSNNLSYSNVTTTEFDSLLKNGLLFEMDKSISSGGYFYTKYYLKSSVSYVNQGTDIYFMHDADRGSTTISLSKIFIKNVVHIAGSGVTAKLNSGIYATELDIEIGKVWGYSSETIIEDSTTLYSKEEQKADPNVIISKTGRYNVVNQIKYATIFTVKKQANGTIVKIQKTTKGIVSINSIVLLKEVPPVIPKPSC